MSLLWMDGFEHYNTTGVNVAAAMSGSYVTIGTGVQLLSMPGLGGLGLRAQNTSDTTGSVRKNLPAGKTSGKVGVGVHWYPGTNNTVDQRNIIIFASAGGTLLGAVRAFYASNQLALYWGGSQVGSPISFSRNTLYHIEAQVLIAGSSTGAFGYRVNGVPIASSSTLTTNGTAVAQIWLGGQGSGGGTFTDTVYDNFYIYDEAGSDNNDWLGEMEVFTLFPSADTADDDWALSTGSSGFTLIDNVPAANTSYIEGVNPGDISKFEVGNLPTVNMDIAGIQVATSAFKSVSGTITMEHGVEINSNDDITATGSLQQTTQTYHNYLIQYSPDTSALWTPSEVNDLLLVYERT